MVYVKMVNWRMYRKICIRKKNNDGKTDNIYKGIISKKRKVNFCLREYLINFNV